MSRPSNMSNCFEPARFPWIRPWPGTNRGIKILKPLIAQESPTNWPIRWGLGTKLNDQAIHLEFNEASLVYYMFFQKKMTNYVTALNAFPEDCLVTESNQVRVQVVGWGQWAYFAQRHICHTVEQNFYFLESVWGVHDKAANFNEKSEKLLGGLRLYPFVRRYIATDEDSYRKSVDDALRVAAQTPELVPATCWNHLFYKPDNWPLYRSKSDSHFKDWFRQDPLPGTVYDLGARLTHPAMIKRPDAMACLERFHKEAPYNDLLIRYLLYLESKDKPTQERAAKLYEAILPYNLNAMVAVADTVRANPAQYEELMLKAAKLNVNCYYILSDFEIDQGNEDKAAKYLDLACASDPDAVQVANHALWRVQYYLKRARMTKPGKSPIREALSILKSDYKPRLCILKRPKISTARSNGITKSKNATKIRNRSTIFVNVTSVAPATRGLIQSLSHTRGSFSQMAGKW